MARLVEAVDPPAQARPPGAAPGAGGGADRMRYELVVEMDGQRRRVVFGEGDVPSELRPLLARLTRLARGARG